MHILMGILGKDWRQLLRENGYSVDGRYWKRAAMLSIKSMMNSRTRKREERQFGEQVAQTKIHPPIFILGHWRSGTTHLQNLLVQDERFAYANLFETSNPHAFLTLEPMVEKAMANAPPQKRGMDNIEVTFRSPGEDEFALAMMSLRSPLLGWVFPRNEAFHDRFLTFRDAAPEDVERWKASVIQFLRKLSFRYGKPLLLKSPPHTGRIRLLLEMFPDARFVHVHRDPYTVFKSTRHLYAQLDAISVQRLDGMDFTDGILKRYVDLYDAFFEDRALIPPEQFHEIRFSDLEKDPMTQIAGTYDQLQLGGFSEVEPKLRSYVDSLKKYEKNKHAKLPDPLVERITEMWGRSFEEWGYPTRAAAAR